MFWKTKTVYTDVLADYRKVKCGEFNLFDKVKVINNWYGRDEFEWVVVAVIDRMKDPKFPALGYIVARKWGWHEWVWTFQYWRKINTSITKDYGEFQKEFEALEKSQKLQAKAEALRRELAETYEESNKEYLKGKKLIEENVELLKIMKSPIIEN